MRMERRWGVIFVILFSLVVCFVSSKLNDKGATEEYIPVVLWHGMGDICCDPLSMGRIKRLLERELPGVYVYSIMVGNNIIEDELNGFFGDVNDQVAQIAGKLANDTNLSRGFSGIGFSQGGQFMRAYVERYNDPPVYNLITMGGQHQGVFGFPDCPINDTICEAGRRLVDLGAYLPFVQAHSVQAQYWHDPLQEEFYQMHNQFLPDINNDDSTFNQTYKDNMLSLQNFVMVQFLNDTVVEPKISEWFGFYAPGQDEETVPLVETPLYIDDYLGLQELNNTGRLIALGCPGNHLDFTDEYFISQIITPFLNETFPAY